MLKQSRKHKIFIMVGIFALLTMLWVVSSGLKSSPTSPFQALPEIKKLDYVASIETVSSDKYVFLRSVPDLQTVPEFLTRGWASYAHVSSLIPNADKTPYENQHEYCQRLAPYLQKMNNILVVATSDKFAFDPESKRFSEKLSPVMLLSEFFQTSNYGTHVIRDQLVIANYDQLNDRELSFQLPADTSPYEAVLMNLDASQDKEGLIEYLKSRGKSPDIMLNLMLKRKEEGLWEANYSYIGIIYFVRLKAPIESKERSATGKIEWSKIKYRVSDFIPHRLDSSVIDSYYGDVVAVWAYDTRTNQILDKLAGEEPDQTSLVYRGCNAKLLQ